MIKIKMRDLFKFLFFALFPLFVPQKCLLSGVFEGHIRALKNQSIKETLLCEFLI